MDAAKLWMVGQWFEGEVPRVVWDFQGIFDSREAAIEACRSWRYFVTPVCVNQSVGDETVEFEDAYYPLPMPESEAGAPVPC